MIVCALPACPKCGNKETTPSKVYSVIVEPSEGERGLTERKVGMYVCSKCGTKFPTVISRQKYLIVAAEQLRKLQETVRSLESNNKELKSKLEELVQRQKELEDQIVKTSKEAQIRELESRMIEIQKYVEHLRKEKVELEQRASELARSKQ